MKAYLHFLLSFLFLGELVLGQTIAEDRTRVFQRVQFFDQISTEVLDIAEDSVGYIWFASTSGIYRWDGGAIKAFRLKEKQDSEIINSVATDLSGNVWASTSDGIYILGKGNDQFVKLDLADSTASVTHQNIRTIRCGPDGNVWADALSGFLLCINTKTFSFQSFKHKKPEIEGEYFYHNISFDTDGNVWIKGRNLEITKFELKSRKFTVYPHPRADDGCILTSNKEIWYGPFQYDQTRQVFELKPRINIKNRIHTMCADKNGHIWLGGSETGLYVFNPSSNSAVHFAYDATDNISLLSNTINKLFCDSQGNIWIVTNKGVCFLPWYYRYIENYRGKQSTGFSESNIRCAIERNNGDWWFGTEANGVQCYNPQTGISSYLNYQLLKPSISETTFKKEYEVLNRYVDLGLVQLTEGSKGKLTLDSWRKGKFPENNESNVNSLFEDRNGNVWIGLYNHVGFNRYSDSEGFKRYGLFYQPDLFYNQPLWGANWYMDFAEDKKGNFWVATWEGFGLNLFNRQSGQFEGKHFMPVDKPYDARILHHALLNDSLALIGGFRYLGLYNFRRNTFQHLKTNQFRSNKYWKELLKYDLSSKITRGQVPPWIANVGGIQKSGKNVWFITDGGLGKMDYKNLTFEIINPGKKIVFTRNYVGCLTASEKNVWFSNGSGLFCYDIESKGTTDYSFLFRKSFPKFDFMNIRKLFLIDQARLLVGTSAGIFEFNIPTNDIKEIGLNLPSKIEVVNIIKYRTEIMVCCLGRSYILCNELLDEAVRHFSHLKSLEGRTIYRFEKADKEEWFATEYGLFYYQPDKGKPLARPYPIPSGAQNIDDVFFLPGQRMILSFNNGLYSVLLDQDKIEDLLEPGPDRLSNRLLSQLFVDSSNNLWMGNTENGIDVLRKSDEKIRHFSITKSLDGSEKKCRINEFCETKNGHIWAASSQGLIHFDHNKVADTVKLPYQQVNTEILSVLSDQKENLWMGTSSGLWVYSPDRKLWINVSQSFDLGSGAMDRAHIKLSDNRLLFSSGKQVVVVDSRLLEHKTNSYNIVLETLKINGSNDMIKLVPDKKIKLDYKQNSLTVNFSLIGIPQTMNRFIAFRTSNENHEWQYLDASERQIRFESLQPGSYHIQLQPVDRQFQPVGSIVFLKLVIIPPFWKRGWVLISIFVILLIGTIGLFRVRNKLAKLREQRMQQVIDIQTADLRSTAQSLRILLKDREKFMSIVSHDLKNPVKGIERLSATLNNTWTQLDETGRKRLFDELHKASSGTSRLLDRLLMWSVQKQGLNQPGLEEVTLLHIISDVVLEVERSAVQKKIRLKTVVDKSLMIKTDREMLSFILRNLLMNAIKYSHQGGVVEIMVKEGPEHISIDVTDHGIGMGPLVVSNLFKPGSIIKQTGTDNEKGTGLALIIVKEFIERLGYSIQVDSMENEGTTFTIIISHTNGK